MFSRGLDWRKGLTIKGKLKGSFRVMGLSCFHIKVTATGFSLPRALTQGVTADLTISSNTHIESWTWPSATSLPCPFEAL